MKVKEQIKWIGTIILVVVLSALIVSMILNPVPFEL